jgi:hypothetical protein
MNEVIKDIEKLKAVQENLSSVWGMDYTKKIIQDMIEEKEIIVKTFEKHHADDRSQWMSDVTKILKIGEK